MLIRVGNIAFHVRLENRLGKHFGKLFEPFLAFLQRLKRSRPLELRPLALGDVPLYS